jgi:hypothetical protein
MIKDQLLSTQSLNLVLNPFNTNNKMAPKKDIGL